MSEPMITKQDRVVAQQTRSRQDGHRLDCICIACEDRAASLIAYHREAATVPIRELYVFCQEENKRLASMLAQTALERNAELRQRLAEVEHERNEARLDHTETFAFYQDEVQQLESMRKERDKARAEVKRLREALEPFAEKGRTESVEILRDAVNGCFKDWLDPYAFVRAAQAMPSKGRKENKT